MHRLNWSLFQLMHKSLLYSYSCTAHGVEFFLEFSHFVYILSRQDMMYRV